MDYKLYKVDETRRNDLKRIIIEALAAQDDIGFAYLFGSFVDGSEAFRDIDLGVYRTFRRTHFQDKYSGGCQADQ